MKPDGLPDVKIAETAKHLMLDQPHLTMQHCGASSMGDACSSAVRCPAST